MEYNDFSLPQNWENLAKAYSESLKEKGFVFIRLDENQTRKNAIASSCFLLLKTLEQDYKQTLKRTSFKQSQALNKLALKSEEFAKQLDNTFKLDKQKSNQNTSGLLNSFAKIFKSETLLFKELLTLLYEEDNPQVRQFIKTSLTSRLETLEEVFD